MAASRGSTPSAPPRIARCSLAWLQSLLNPRVLAARLSSIWRCNVPQYGLSFFLPQIVKAFGVSAMCRPASSPRCPMRSARSAWSCGGGIPTHQASASGTAIFPPGHGAVGPRRLPPSIADPVPRWRACASPRFGFFSILPVFWTLPTAFLSGVGGGRRYRRGQFDRQSRRLFRAAGLRLSQGHDAHRFLRHVVLRSLRRRRRGARVGHGTRHPPGAALGQHRRGRARRRICGATQ